MNMCGRKGREAGILRCCIYGFSGLSAFILPFITGNNKSRKHAIADCLAMTAIPPYTGCPLVWKLNRKKEF